MLTRDDAKQVTAAEAFVESGPGFRMSANHRQDNEVARSRKITLTDE
jgi:hypothetical protein